MTTGVGVLSIEDEKLSAAQNEIDGAFVGLFGTFDPRVDGPAFGNSFTNNTVSNSLFGTIIDCESTGYTAVNNEFQGSFLVDVLLDGTSPGGECAPFGLGDSHDNTIVATDFVTTVLDFGVDNHLVGTLAMTNNPGVPDDLRQTLIAMRESLGQP